MTSTPRDGGEDWRRMRLYDLHSPHCERARMYWEPEFKDRFGRLIKPRMKRHKCEH